MFAVPVMTQVISPPQTQTEPKKPTPKHGNEHKEEHVLFKPPKAGNGNDEPAANGHDETGENGKNKGDSKSGFSVNTNRNVQGKINSEMNEILENSDNGKNKESASTTMTEMFSGTAKKSMRRRGGAWERGCVYLLSALSTKPSAGKNKLFLQNISFRFRSYLNRLLQEQTECCRGMR